MHKVCRLPTHCWVDACLYTYAQGVALEMRDRHLGNKGYTLDQQRSGREGAWLRNDPCLVDEDGNLILILRCLGWDSPVEAARQSGEFRN